MGMKKERFSFKRYFLTGGRYLLSFLLIALFLPERRGESAMDLSQCAIPLFINEGSVKPNIFLLLDNSGSMNQEAWSGNYTFNTTRSYYGYFEPNRCYRFLSNKFEPGPLTDNLWRCDEATNGGYPFSGNFMNWAYMTRLEILKKVLVGGRWNGASGLIQGEGTERINPADFCFDPSPYTPLASGAGVHVDRQSGNWIMQRLTTCNPNLQGESNHGASGAGTHSGSASSYSANIRQDTEPIGIVLELQNEARWAAGVFNTYEGGSVVHYYGFNVAGGGSSLVNTIRTLDAPNWTPSAESFYEFVRYHIQAPPYYNNNDYNRGIGSNRDPWFEWEGSNQFVPCRKTFILFITDGKPTQDLNLPSDLLYNTGIPGSAPRDYDGDALDTGTQVSSALPLPGWPPTCSGDYTTLCPTFQQPNNVGTDNGSAYLDDVAFFAHNTDLRTDLPGRQNIISYFVFTFGDISPTGYERSAPWILWNAAIKGGFEDKNGNQRPDLQSEWDENGDGVPDAFFLAQDGNDIENAIRAAVLAILKRTSSGTSVAILSQSEEGEGSIYQAYFNPEIRVGMDKVNWVGFLRGLFMDRFGNLREDRSPSGNIGDGVLTLTVDRILKYRFDPVANETFVDLYPDANGDGVTDPPGIPEASVKIHDLSSTFEAGKLLAIKDGAQRTIYSQIGGVRQNFTPANAPLFAPYMNTDPTLADEIISYVRGESDFPSLGWRSRTMDVDGTPRIWKLGDIIFSTPTVVGAPADRYDILYGDVTYQTFYSTYKNRRNIIYVGSNDGILHAFNGGFFFNGDTVSTSQVDEAYYLGGGFPLGEELWGWVPFNLLPHLQWLKEDQYCHVYYMDLAPRALDLRIFTPDGDHPSGWGTVLVGGMGLGCKPVTVSGTTFRSSYVLLDITRTDDLNYPKSLLEYNDPNLGFTTVQPTVAKVGDQWYLIFGSGPTPTSSPPDYISSTPARLYVLNLSGGPSAILTMPGSSNEYLNRPVAIDMGKNYDVDTIYVASTITSGGSLSGKIYRISTRKNPGDLNPDPDPRNWRVSVFFTAPAGSPFSTAPRFAMDDEGNSWIFVGSGRYLSVPDKTDTNQQRFFAIKDPCILGNCSTSYTISNLTNVTNCFLKADGTFANLGGGGPNCPFSNASALRSAVASSQGWYINFPLSGERNVTRSVVTQKTVYFSSFIPSGSVCSGGGYSRLWALSFNTGMGLVAPVNLGTGIAHIPKAPGRLIVQTGTGSLAQYSLISQESAVGIQALIHPLYSQ